MSKKSSKPGTPARPFGPLGTGVIAIFIFFFMLLPGALITFQATGNFLQQSGTTLNLPALTGALMAGLLGCLLFFTGCFLIWKIIWPAPLPPEAL